MKIWCLDLQIQFNTPEYWQELPCASDVLPRHEEPASLREIYTFVVLGAN